jgi:hypothetical protein
MEAKTKNILVGVGIGILTYILIKNKKPSAEIKSSAEGEDTISVDGEYYNADGDFYGADGNFYDADGSFMGADGSFESAEGDFYGADGSFESAEGYENANGKKRKRRRKVKVRKSKKASKSRSLALTKQKASMLNASKKRVARTTTPPSKKARTIANINEKIKYAMKSIAKGTGYLD